MLCRRGGGSLRRYLCFRGSRALGRPGCRLLIPRLFWFLLLASTCRRAGRRCGCRSSSLSAVLKSLSIRCCLGRCLPGRRLPFVRHGGLLFLLGINCGRRCLGLSLQRDRRICRHSRRCLPGIRRFRARAGAAKARLDVMAAAMPMRIMSSCFGEYAICLGAYRINAIQSDADHVK